MIYRTRPANTNVVIRTFTMNSMVDPCRNVYKIAPGKGVFNILIIIYNDSASLQNVKHIFRNRMPVRYIFCAGFHQKIVHRTMLGTHSRPDNRLGNAFTLRVWKLDILFFRVYNFYIHHHKSFQLV